MISFTLCISASFQLHHTGIKTSSAFRIWGRSHDFNCTIQELKLKRRFGLAEEFLNFNCTIQELKQRKAKRPCRNQSRFQLHHTGIKTWPDPGWRNNIYGFQLHHTGIKTKEAKKMVLNQYLFQLHHTGIKTNIFFITVRSPANFNCTIQELKRPISSTGEKSISFQLHHTGIKTKHISLTPHML